MTCPLKYDDQPVRVFRRFWRCPECGDGHAAFTGSILPCTPPRYQHRCNQCGMIFSAEAQTGAIMYEYDGANPMNAQNTVVAGSSPAAGRLSEDK